MRMQVGLPEIFAQKPIFHLLLRRVSQSQSEDSHANTQVDIQGTVPFPGIWVEGFSAGLSAPGGSGGGDQAARPV